MSHPAPRRLYDLREWLLDRIDGSEETRGDDGLISDFIRQIDALPSEMGTIPDAERKKVMEAHRLAGTVEPKGCPTPGACSAVEEIADLKQRLLPQFAGRAQRAEHERDALLEQLIAARSATAATDAEVDAFVRMARTFSDEHYQNSLVAELRRVYHALFALRDAPPVEVAEPDRPDWARQLPGAEIFDRDHGYDRTASLNAGKYVCLCGGACSHYDAGEKPK